MLDDRRLLVHQVLPGMDVCDVSGEKVGTVAKVRGEIVEVKTGPFGLGRHLWVPPSALDGVTDAGVILRHAKHDFHGFGLDASRQPQLLPGAEEAPGEYALGLDRSGDRGRLLARADRSRQCDIRSLKVGRRPSQVGFPSRRRWFDFHPRC